MLDFIKKMVGSANDREIKRLAGIVDHIRSFEPEMRRLPDARLQGMTGVLKEKIEQGAALDDVLPEAFALVREAGLRTLGQRHFDVQMMGGIVLHQGKIAEMKTGEGKTLAATLPVYLNALTGRGVHVVTVNDYLASRDAGWMGAIYNFLGLSVGVIIHGLDDAQRRAAYRSDITYGTNNEFGFDYLRDNMKFSLDEYVQREFNFAIVDEVDSILIDEARTPLIISGPAEQSTDKYYRINRIIPRLHKEKDYSVDEKARAVSLSEDGVAHAEKMLGVENLYDPKNMDILHHVTQALKAHALFTRDTDYIVQNGQVVIVDEFTGRLMPGRRYSDGLHQALEAKEGVKIENENQTLASITFQNFFRMYDKLAGMTGTADTEAEEFAKIYNLGVVVMPTDKEMIRIDNPDMVYRTVREKYDAVIEEIEALYEKGQPVLVGTISISNSELISKRLKLRGVPHQVLNAKHHAQEAAIVSMAGQKHSVTISTNMAGRGTDIVLGEGVPALGGLHILGTERHEARRIDNQLRGRSGRQGDPGSSRFYLSLEDDLLRIFGGERLQGIMGRLGMEEGEPIEHTLISRAIENAQKKVEGHNFEIRKQLLEYDDVMNKQREVIYSQRRQILAGENLKEECMGMIEDLADGLIDQFTDEKKFTEDWDLEALAAEAFKLFNLRLEREKLLEFNRESLREFIVDQAKAGFDAREQEYGPKVMGDLQRYILLQSVDNQWKDHLLSMDHLKEGIGLRGYGQRDPLREYQREGYDMFMELVDRIKADAVSFLFHIRLQKEEDLQAVAPKEQEMYLSRGDDDSKAEPVKRKDKKVGRNDPCPCGSGKKYKKCHGAGAAA